MILWWWFNGNWYNIITILIPIESKWWAKWWQNVGKYMLYWKCVGTYLEHHLKFIWNYEHHVSQHGTSYDYMMNIWWTLYEICMNTVATCGNQVNGSKISTCQTWKTGWRITGWPVHPATMAAMLKVPYPNPDGFFFYMASTAVPPQDLDGDDDEDDFVAGQSPTFSVPQRYHWTFFKILISIWIWFEAIGIIWNSFGYELNIYEYMILYWYYDRLHYTIFILWLYIIYHYMIIYDHFLFEIWYKFDMNLFFSFNIIWTWDGHGYDMGLILVWMKFDWDDGRWDHGGDDAGAGTSQTRGSWTTPCRSGEVPSSALPQAGPYPATCLKDVLKDVLELFRYV